MTVQDMIDRLEKMNPDKIVVFIDEVGWSNIEELKEMPHEVHLTVETIPVHSES